jgi:ATP-dependent DNA helicase RecQ
MVEQRPQTLAQLSRVSGVGEKKRDAYGEAFLEVLQEYLQLEAGGESDTEEASLQLFRLGMNAAAIAAQRGLKASTIYSHLAAGIARGEVPLKDVIALDDHQLEAIRFAIEHHGEGKRLKPVFDALEGEFPYELLRCVLADMARL